MPRSDTQFRKGRSGNPAGRPAGRPSARDAVRRALDKPDVIDPTRSRLDAWSEQLVTEAVASEDKLAILKWLEGSAPGVNVTLSAPEMTHEDWLDQLDDDDPPPPPHEAALAALQRLDAMGDG